MSEKNNLLNRLLVTVHNNSALLIRLTVGLIFLSEGIQKFLFPDALGTGRFVRIGFSHAEFWAYLTAVFETASALLILPGLFTRIASIPLLIIMITAFVATKWPILMHEGFWTFAHEYRTDFAMTVLLIYLLLYGSGRISIDYRLSKRLKQKS